MTSLFLRRATAPDKPVGPLTPDDVAAAAPSAEDCLSLGATSSFASLDLALDRDGDLREALLEGFPSRGASRYARWRIALFAGLVPILVLAELDRQLAIAGHHAAFGSLAIDALFVLACTIDLARRLPRMHYVTAASFGAAGLRLLLVIASRCGDVHPIMPGLVVSAGLSATATMLLSPSPRAVADHLRRALALAPPTRLPPTSAPGFYAYIAYAIAAAAALPLLLHLLRTRDTPVDVQIAAFVLFALIVPHAGRVWVGKEPPPLRTAVAEAAGVNPRTFRPSFAMSARAIVRALQAGCAMLVLSFALVRGSQNLLEAAAMAQRCSASDPEAGTMLDRFIDAERHESAPSNPPKGLGILLLTVGVVPVAEELVYRGLVQHALRRRVRRHVAIALSAMLFGLAHLLVYEALAWQTVLLGLSFGLAYESAGLLASILVHMLWNLWLSV